MNLWEKRSLEDPEWKRNLELCVIANRLFNAIQQADPVKRHKIVENYNRTVAQLTPMRRNNEQRA